MTDWLRLALSNPLSPGLAALAGTGVGGRIALHRYRGERAIDRRIDWYSRMCMTLYRMAGVPEIARHLEMRGPQADAAVAHDQVAAHSDAFKPLRQAAVTRAGARRFTLRNRHRWAIHGSWMILT